jgi:PAS domain S-box-containing protein
MLTKKSTIREVSLYLQKTIDCINKLQENNTPETEELDDFKSRLSDFIIQLKRKNINLENVESFSFIDNDALASIMNQMIQYAELNFNNHVEIKGDDDVLNTIATTVNLLGEELEDKIKQLQELNITLEVNTEKSKAKNQELSGVMKALDNSALIVICDTKGTIVKVNKGFCDTSKYKEEELIGKNISIINSNAHPKEFWKDMWSFVEKGKTWRNEVKCKAKNGSKFWMDMVINPINNIHGNITHYLSISNLITDKKKQEQYLIKNEKALKKSLKEKDTLLQEVHHRVKNNLQMISSLMDLQIKRATEKEVIKQLTDSQSRIKAMSLLHEKLYQSDNITLVNISEYTISLLNSFITMYDDEIKKKIQVKHIIEDDIHLSIPRAIPFGLIVNEIMSNCYKHAFNKNESGIISISLYKENDTTILRIKDSGKGMDTSVDFKSFKSLGMKLITSLSSQLKAEVSFLSVKGLTVTLTFK